MGRAHYPKYGIVVLNPILVNVPILYSLNTPENQKCFGVFKWFKMGTFARTGVVNGV